jgi:hypothetical protein
MAQVFYNMNLLSSTEYVECSASDLIAQYVGQTGPKTVGVLKKALGKVLFVDEAYRLGEGHFAKEAIDELVDSLTKPQFFGKLVVILAGYDEDMNKLLNVNPGLSSRFPEEVVFKHMTSGDCLTLLQNQLKEAGIELVLGHGKSGEYQDIVSRFTKLSSLRSWGNGRDVKTISKAVVGAAFENADPSMSSKLAASGIDVLTALDQMLKERMARCTEAKPLADSCVDVPLAFDTATRSFLYPTPASSTSTATKGAEQEISGPTNETPNQDQDTLSEPRETHRDEGVSDETWAQLQIDIREDELAHKQTQDAVSNLEQQVKTAADNQQACEQEAARSKPTAWGDDSDDKEFQEQKRRHEEARLRALMARIAQRDAEDKLRKAREEEDRQRKERARIQQKIRKMGVCPVGFRWIKQSGGYRCAGGTHFVTNGQLGI